MNSPAASQQSALLRRIAPLAMILGVLAVYFPAPRIFRGEVLVQADYTTLHQRRIEFAREMLNAPGGPVLSGWYPRELLGTPFWSNVQSFPFIPTRLILLLIDPAYAYVYAVALAAVLTALFTYLYARTIDLSPVAAAVAGWTFACCGFFASRVMAGQLALLEAFAGLPLLLWLVEISLRDSGARRGKTFARKLAAIALSCTCLALAGHPQLPMYALFTAAVYLLYRGWGKWRRVVLIGGAMLIEVGIAAFALWPMALLVGRSTRILHLAHSPNDIAMPYARLKTFLFPWSDGWPPMVNRSPRVPFSGYPNYAYFWDTVCYIGWMPVIAVAFLLIRAVVVRRRQGDPMTAAATPGVFLAIVGVLSVLLALPFWQQLMSHIPGTFIRSPSRQLYLTSFALAFALAAAVDALLKYAARSPARVRINLGIAVLIVIAVHVLDVTLHARCFVATAPPPVPAQPPLEWVSTYLGSSRTAVDVNVVTAYNRQVDDVGFYDAIMLAGPYRAILDLMDLPPGTNVENIDGAQMPKRALEACGVKLVVTTTDRPDLKLVAAAGSARVYELAAPHPRAKFFAAGDVRFLTVEQIHENLRRPEFDLRRTLMLELPDASVPAAARSDAPASASPASADYWRPSADVIEVDVASQQDGFVRVIESYDRGWSATVDGQAAEVLAGDDFFLAVRVPAGSHQVRFTFRTPGARTGLNMSFVSVLLLVGWCMLASRWPIVQPTSAAT